MLDDRSEAPGSSGPPLVSMVLVFAGALLMAALIISVWANRQMLDTEGWVKTSERVLRDAEVQAEVAQYVTDEIFSYLDVSTDLRPYLPPRLQNLEDTSVAGLRRIAPAEIGRELNTAQFEQIWAESNREAHRSLLAALGDGDGNRPSDNRRVVLDLNPLLTSTSRQLGFTDQVTGQIPPQAARLTVLEWNEISTARDAEKLIRVLPFVLSFLIVMFFGTAILVAGSRRSQVVSAIGAGLVLAGLIALLVRELARPSLLDLLTKDDSIRLAAEAAWGISTSLLVTLSIWSMVIGALIFASGLAQTIRVRRRSRLWSVEARHR